MVFCRFSKIFLGFPCYLGSPRRLSATLRFPSAGAAALAGTSQAVPPAWVAQPSRWLGRWGGGMGRGLAGHRRATGRIWGKILEKGSKLWKNIGKAEERLRTNEDFLGLFC